MLRMMLTVLAFAFGASAVRAADVPPHPVVLVSIDGFRADYLSRGLTPNLAALARRGVRARWMTPSFPSITFPNHWALVTGKVPDENGIVGNTMYDPAIPEERFALSDRKALADPRWWQEATPIWVTAEKAGIRTATMFWPGSEVAVDGVRPSDWRPFDGKMSATARVDVVLGWLARPAATRPGFVTLYFDAVDHAGHEHGPRSREVDAALVDVDAAIGRLTAGLAAEGVDANVVVVSDHGMAAVPAGHVVRMDRIAPAGSYRFVTGGAYAGVDPVLGHEAELASALAASHRHVRCWAKGDLPARFRYGRNPRVPAFVCLADVGWIIRNGDGGERAGGGSHGYDNEVPDMRALFVAAGPGISAGVTLAAFPNVEVHALLASLLGLEPAADVPSPIRQALRLQTSDAVPAR